MTVKEVAEKFEKEIEHIVETCGEYNLASELGKLSREVEKLGFSVRYQETETFVPNLTNVHTVVVIDDVDIEIVTYVDIVR